MAKQRTLTQSVTSTQLAVATLAMLAAGGAALVAAPVNNAQGRAVQNICIPAIVELSEPCNAVVRGQPRAVPGFRRMRYVCPGSQNGRGFISTGTCRTQEKMNEDAARGCQRQNQCALQGYGYGYNIPQPDYGYNYNANAQEPLPPAVSFSNDTPSQFTGQAAGAFTSVLAKVVVSNPNNVPMTLRGMGWTLYGNGISFTNTSTRRSIDVASEDIYTRGVNARVEWNLPNRFNGEEIYFSARPGNFSPILIPARGSKVVYVNTNLQGLHVPDVSTGYIGFRLATNIMDWSVGAFTSSSYPRVDNYDYRIINVSRVLPPNVSWAGDTPSGASAGSAEQVIGKIVVSNGGNNQDDLLVSGLSLQIQTRFAHMANTATTTVKIYRDAMAGAPVATASLVVNRAGIQEVRFDQPVGISRNSSRRFLVTMNTSQASVDDFVLFTLPSTGLSWSISGISSQAGAGLPSLPLSVKTLTY